MTSLSFEQLGLAPELLHAVKDLGFETPTEIQQQTLPVLLDGPKDIIALSQTGTGKTAAYSLPIIEHIDLDAWHTQALILSPTRELCIQIARDIESYTKYIHGLRVVAVYGGADIQKQIKQLKKGAHIIVATPGRMLDLLKRGKADVTTINTVVLDEADEMLNMGFKEDLNAILFETPRDKNTLLFSATMPPEADRLAKQYMENPLRITIGKKNAGSVNVSHVYYMVQARDRYKALRRLIDYNPDMYAIVFCRTRRETREIADHLMRDGYEADALHGELTQAQRDHVMKKFRLRNIRLLVATDVAARGLDVNDLSHVINIDLPEDVEAYTHRSGRTGRAGKTGVCMSIIHSREKSKLRRIEQIIKAEIVRQPIPSGEKIVEQQVLHFVERLRSVETGEGAHQALLPAVGEKLADMSREELIERLVKLELELLLKLYKNAPDLNFKEKRRDREERRPAPQRGNWAGLEIGLGEKQGMQAGDIIGMINRATRSKDVPVGKIRVQHSRTYFEVDADYADWVMEGMRKVDFRGRPVYVEKSGPGKERRVKKARRY
ncbi:MAG: DEAD/DEAH box helicase [Calditrichaeota bacterium]|nr:MAG: DEAD/DEAH box helicase [Calditrichota bacterium]